MMTASMSSRRAAIALALIACHRAPSARERLLDKLDGDSVTVVVAEGRALGHPRVRGVLDVVGAHWPSSMSCVVAAAFASDQAALTVDRSGNVSVLVATTADPKCAALSQRAPGLWTATIGAPPSTPATSVLDDPRFARARPYLATAPIAGAALGDVHLLGTAQPDPLEAWVAIDVPGSADAVEHALADQLARMQRDPSTSAVASRLHTSRADPAQIVVRLAGPVDGDLAVSARTLLAWMEQRARPSAASFACPAPVPGITCSNGTSFRLGSLRTDLAAILTAGKPSPIVSNGAVTGLRLEAPVAQFGLEAGDVVLAMADRLITSRAMFAERIAQARSETTMTIRRGATEKRLQFVER
jgi:hypothetical protein